MPLSSNQANSLAPTGTFVSDMYNWEEISIFLDADGTLTIPSGNLAPNSMPLSQVLGTKKDTVKQIVINNTLKLLSDASSLFSGFLGLTSIKNTPLIDVSEAIKLDFFFELNRSLTELDVATWNTSSVTTLHGIVHVYSSIKSA